MNQVNIYLIQDCDGLKYVGSTTQTLNRRLSKHRSDKNIGRYYSSCKLNLDKCEIYSLEVCNELDRNERERFWINEFDTVNDLKLNGQDMKKKEYWTKNNKEKIKGYDKEYRKKNKEYYKEITLFKRKSIVNGCYEFIKMLDEY